jgi:hypothetical protein
MSESQVWRNWSLEIPPVEGAYKTNQGWVIDRPNGTQEVLVAISANNFVDTSNADISSVKFPKSKVYVAGDNLDFIANFNEPVAITNTPRLVLTFTSGTVYANYLSGSGTNKIKFRYTVQSNDFKFTGVTLNPDMDLNSTGTVKDKNTSINSNITFPGATDLSVTVDALPRTISSVSASSGNRTTGQFVDITVSFNRLVLVNTSGGVPFLQMFANDGTTPLANSRATYLSGDSTSSLIFRYVVKNTDSQASAIKAGANISLNGGLITDTSKTANASVTFTQATLTGVTLN